MWFKNLFIYHLPAWEENTDSLEEKLASQALQDCGSMEQQTQGWVSTKTPISPLIHTQEQHLLITLSTQKKLLPSSIINQFAKARSREIEEKDGYKPGRKQMKDIRETVRDELLPRAFVIENKTRAWIDTQRQLLLIDTSSATKADEFISLLIKSAPSIGGVTLFKTKGNPMTAMTAWLAENSPPTNFSIDQDCELRSRGEGNSTVRYVRHDLESAEIKKHIENGKDVTRLALTWKDKISFTLQENLQLKKITALNLLEEKQNTGSTDDEKYDNDFSLMTGEIGLLIDNLINELGGKSEFSLKK